MIAKVMCPRIHAPIVTADQRDLLNRRPEEGCCYSTLPSCPVTRPGRAGDGQRRSTPRLRSRRPRSGTARGPPGGPRRAVDVDAHAAGTDHRLVAVDPAHPGAGRGGRGHRRRPDLAHRGARKCAGHGDAGQGRRGARAAGPARAPPPYARTVDRGLGRQPDRSPGRGPRPGALGVPAGPGPAGPPAAVGGAPRRTAGADAAAGAVGSAGRGRQAGPVQP